MTVTSAPPDLERAQAAAATLGVPERPMRWLADLSVLRDASVQDGTVVVAIAPTYSGCPAMATMRADLLVTLHRAGFTDVDVRTVLSPPWSTDWITERGRRALAQHGIAPPGTAPTARRPVDLGLPGVRSDTVTCPMCGSADTTEVSRFGSTACKAIYRCDECTDTFDLIKTR